MPPHKVCAIIIRTLRTESSVFPPLDKFANIAYNRTDKETRTITEVTLLAGRVNTILTPAAGEVGRLVELFESVSSHLFV
jgi:hypothetical protein